MINYISIISSWSVPIIIALFLSYAIIKKVEVYNVFTEGASEGLKTCVNIFPYLLAMILAINLFRASGAMELLVKLFNPIISWLNVPEEVVPLLFLRPLSGSGSLSYTAQIIKDYGPDSYIGKLASTIQGSTETTFYIIAVYFGAVGIKKYRYAVIVGIIADVAGFFAAVFICGILF
ncbi:spore maturation protein [Natronospora cellulosivora (SeqCode)]